MLSQSLYNQSLAYILNSFVPLSHCPTHLAKPQQDAAELNVVGEKPMIILTGLTLHLLPQTSSGTLVLIGSHTALSFSLLLL